VKYVELEEAYVAVYEKEAPDATLIWACTTSIIETHDGKKDYGKAKNQNK
jgi:hypothetical protein